MLYKTISCIHRKPSHYPSHDRIAAIGGINADNTKWKNAEVKAITAMEEKRESPGYSLRGGPYRRLWRYTKE